MQTQLEGQVAQLVAEIVRQTEQRVERAFGEALAGELAARQNGNGHAPDVEAIADEQWIRVRDHGRDLAVGTA